MGTGQTNLLEISALRYPLCSGSARCSRRFSTCLAIPLGARGSAKKIKTFKKQKLILVKKKTTLKHPESPNLHLFFVRSHSPN